MCPASGELQIRTSLHQLFPACSQTSVSRSIKRETCTTHARVWASPKSERYVSMGEFQHSEVVVVRVAGVARVGDLIGLSSM
jgi:hypothetical protein